MGETVLIRVGTLGLSGQAADHDVRQAQVDIGAAAGGRGFVFAAQQAEAAQPAERAFDDPAVRQNDEPRQVIAAFNDLQCPTELVSTVSVAVFSQSSHQTKTGTWKTCPTGVS